MAVVVHCVWGGGVEETATVSGIVVSRSEPRVAEFDSYSDLVLLTLSKSLHPYYSSVHGCTCRC